jgi:hypothetical protein
MINIYSSESIATANEIAERANAAIDAYEAARENGTPADELEALERVAEEALAEFLAI